jgi:predicted Zn-dependent protease
MKDNFIIIALYLGFFLIPVSFLAQEEKEINVEESAEVFLEDYSDDFQENFFEALKQKSIENYDKTINLLLKCKQLDAENRVVDHELAKAYYEDKKYVQAEEYAVVALTSEPDNLWYLETLVEILEKQGTTIDAVATKIPYDNPKLKENLALTYFKSGNYEDALKVLKEVKKSIFSEDLTTKINDSVEKRNAQRVTTSFSMENTNSEAANPMQGYQQRIEGLIRTNSHIIVQQVSEEALEIYPSQPFFYYAQGYALNKNNKHRDAIEVLEAGLDYLVNDVALANKFYTELAAAYTASYNTVKANMYLSKIKPGF